MVRVRAKIDQGGFWGLSVSTKNASGAAGISTSTRPSWVAPWENQKTTILS